MVTLYPDGPLDGTYIVPPVFYPQSDQYCIKLGHHDQFEAELQGGEVTDWWAGQGDPRATTALTAFLHRLVPGLQTAGPARGAACVTACTPARAAPYIDQVLSCEVTT